MISAEERQQTKNFWSYVIRHRTGRGNAIPKYHVDTQLQVCRPCATIKD